MWRTENIIVEPGLEVRAKDGAFPDPTSGMRGISGKKRRPLLGSIVDHYPTKLGKRADKYFMRLEGGGSIRTSPFMASFESVELF